MKIKKRYSYLDTQGNRPNVESCDMCDASIVDIGNRRLSVPTIDSPNVFDPKFRLPFYVKNAMTMKCQI
jgi:hypothetical protein